MKQLNVLISLHPGYGLGDAVQMSAVLQHVAKHRPHWLVDYQAEEGRHQAGRAYTKRTFAHGTPYTTNYDAEVQILLFDTWANWHDRPNTRVSSCLHERFGMDWDADCGTYKITVTPDEDNLAQILLRNGNDGLHRSSRFVAVHYQGDSSQERKNLTHGQADAICQAINSIKRTPLILDWRCRSPLGYRRLRAPAAWGRDVAKQCAVIDACEAFIGIDSGPSKCASATNTPSLVIWTGHHPAPFHDPAPNTTHLVPVGYHGLYPVCNDPGVIRWFEANHNVRYYRNSDPVLEACNWLREVLQ